jgi:glycyl-tRNA synthetase beta chain
MLDFLLELGTEEIPAGYIAPALEQGKSFLSEYLKRERLNYQDIRTYATPRRLVFFISRLPEQQSDINKEIIGPSYSVAFGSENTPTPAYYGFIKKYGLKEKDVKIRPTGSRVCYANITIKGEMTGKILSGAVISLVKTLSFPKSMWWKEKALTFARPLRYILSLLGNKPLKIKLSNLFSGNKTSGHQFFSSEVITIRSANFRQFQDVLKKHKVIVNQDERKRVIQNQIQKIARRYNASCNEPLLLDEVVYLVEYPLAIECKFDENFLRLPDSVIESAMKSHQRYFPLRDKQGRLCSKFIVVSNNPNIKTRKDIVPWGYERVLKARLSDALFFWEQDRRVPLEEYAKKLENIAFLGKLGTMAEKSERLSQLSSFIASKLNYRIKDTLERSSKLCKADLLTGMVGEFPDLQGIIGYEYLKDKEPEVAIAIREHYQPRFVGDGLPQTPAGICLSLAEKLDNIAGCFLIGLKPTGSQDRYGLRRQARAIIESIIAKNLRLPLEETIYGASAPLRGSAPQPSGLVQEILSFIADRLIQMYLDKGYNTDLINGVITSGFDDLIKFDKRLCILNKLSKEEVFWDELVEVVERTYNISKGLKITCEIDGTLLKEKEEIELYRLYQENKDLIQGLIEEEKYGEASRLYHQVFAKAAHIFFEKVFVNVEDASLSNNRLLLNKKINELYSKGIADLSKIPRVRTTDYEDTNK